MVARPYSFRYPYDIQTVLDRWRQKLASALTGDETINRLSDRDRAIEDYLSLGVAQGILDIGTQTGGAFAVPTSSTDIPGMTTTVTVPPNRMLRISSVVFVENSSAAAGTFVFTNVLEDGVIIRTEYFAHGAAGGTAGQYLHQLPFYYTPTAGEHTYKTQISALALGLNASTLFGNTITVEDVGPAARFT